jgi:UDP-3-O-[3-hydroxymyristoyl] glucosamine N-acyltransferase
MHQTSTGDSRFYARRGPFSMARVQQASGGFVTGRLDLMLTGVGPLQSAGPAEVSFLDDRRYIGLLEKTRAGAVIVDAEMAKRVPSSAVAIVSDFPYEGWTKVARLFHPEPAVRTGRHSTAFVHPSATVDESAEIGPFAFVGRGVTIGPHCRIGAHVTIEDGVSIGTHSRVGANSSVSHAMIGSRVCLHPGVRVGQDGFGLARTQSGVATVPQLGRVVIEDDVEIGANSTVDRGSTQDTLIGAGTRLDNLVHIGHNVRIGRCCVIVAQVGIAGSTILEDFVQVGGQAGMAPHLTIGSHAKIGAQAGVISDVPAGSVMLGSPAQPRMQFLRQVALLKGLTGALRKHHHQA